MEELVYFFNSDFEERLFSTNQKGYHSNQHTQEFEYFISVIDPSATIYSEKIYSNEYKDFFKHLTGQNLKVTKNPQNVINWCQEYNQIEMLRKFQDKIQTLHYFQKLNFYQHQIQLIDSPDLLKENVLYKDPHNLSGMGHYEYPKSKIKLEKLLKTKTLIAEDILERVKDFSTLFENQQMIGQYENIIDKHHQYKGSFISSDHILEGKLRDEYNLRLDSIQKYTQEYLGVFSVDSFLYIKEGHLVLQPICELNMRKTMGYTALKLKVKYFSEFSHLKFFIKRNKKKIDYEKLDKIYGGKVLMISPNENLFQVWIIAGHSKLEVKDLESQLFFADF